MKQGVLGKHQRYYDNSKVHNGSNGTYTSKYKTEYAVDLYLTIYGDKPEDNKKVKIDIRQDILDKNELQRISKKKMDSIKDDNVGKR